MRQACLIALLATLLGACAGPARQIPSPQSWLAHSGQLEAYDYWEATGKLALRTPGGSESANLVWRQADTETHIHLSGPLGVAPVNMHSDGRWLEVRRGAQTSTLDLRNPDEVTAATGWDFPLQALPYWLKGLPTPAFKLQRLEQDSLTGGASLLQQDDWEVRFERYSRFENLNLPTRITITDGEAKATVLIRRWRTHHSERQSDQHND